MKVLVIGGSGYVAGLTLPYLKESHELRVFDLKPPADSSLEFYEGNVGDLEALTTALQGMDALLFLAMGTQNWQGPEAATQVLSTAFDVSVKGVYMALRAAHEARVGHAVYASSLSAYRSEGWRGRYFAREEMVPDAIDCYGLTKRLGEEVCRAAVIQWGLSINALRLCRPVSPEEYQEKVHLDQPSILTCAPDVARAFDAALRYKPAGFEAFFISGDYNQQRMSMAKAKELLDWEPLARPTT